MSGADWVILTKKLIRALFGYFYWCTGTYKRFWLNMLHSGTGDKCCCRRFFVQPSTIFQALVRVLEEHNTLVTLFNLHFSCETHLQSSLRVSVAASS